jgi:peptidoglycan/xylan/chitin deacetylase (PgdA/CDA1 family)
MKAKRELFSDFCSVAGITGLLERLPSRGSVIVLNYHRIGNANETQYDPGVFSATTDEFAWQLDYLKRHFRVTTLERVVAVAQGKQSAEPSILITFDDGYLDNYELAFPILQAAGLQGTFFLPTSYIGTNRLPWWDVVAYVVKNAQKKEFWLSYPFAVDFNIGQLGIDGCIAKVLKTYKHADMKDGDRFISELAKSSDSSLPTEKLSCFMDWEQAREMRDAGMAFGGHTHTHEILSRQTAEQQLNELQLSRQILERELNQEITTMSYPDGGPTAFNTETEDIAKKSGYVAAFSFYGGFNGPDDIRPYEIRRFGVDGQSRKRFRLQVGLGSVSGSVWV